MKLALKANGTPCNLNDIEGEISCTIFQAFDLNEVTRSEFSRIILRIGPRHQRKVAHNALVRDRLMNCARIFGPARPQQ
jgi:hypothetical protein